ncbi:MAG: hypothetical protein CYPHOPRED_005314 [Cyphobasidiales sp. Tagirdzhanova-0007]|nr:MAG: hypothetical protein CYPHOPRED_005314 [Cyphobasidiales sp. Tagirdzhanova-0007]
MVITYPKWLLFGDSITQRSFCAGGLGQHLADTYVRKIDIVNRGYGGYNSRWGLHVLPLAKSKQPLKAINIWWGANDATLPMRPQSIPVAEFKKNLNALIDMLQSPDSAYYSPDTIIILLSPPPICVPQRQEEVRRLWGDVKLDRTAERTKEFADATEEVAKQRRIGFVPVFDAMMAAAGPSPDEGLRKLLCDGLHLTATGYQVVTDAFMKVIQRDYTDIAPDNMPRIFPEWGQIDPQSPEAAFPRA